MKREEQTTTKRKIVRRKHYTALRASGSTCVLELECRHTTTRPGSSKSALATHLFCRECKLGREPDSHLWDSFFDER